MEFGKSIYSAFNKIYFIFITYLEKFKQILSRCELCQQSCQNIKLLCDHCEQDLPYFSDTFTDTFTQGNLLNWPAINQLLKPYQFDQLICLSSYQWPFSQWISQCKYHGRFELAHLFSQLLSKHWQQLSLQHQLSQPDVIMAVPIHINRWKTRGFNQAHLMAKSFADDVNIPYHTRALKRNKATVSQVGKSGVQRRKNIKNAISLSAEFTKLKPLPEHVLLIDDVVTTGATANEVCRLLKKQGVKKVTLMTLCISLVENN